LSYIFDVALTSDEKKMQSIVRRITTTARQPLVNPIPFTPRLESHYYDNLYEDLVLLNYDHTLEVKESEWELPELSPEELYSMPFEKLPTRPESDLCTNFLSTKFSHVGLPQKESGFVRKFKNPIDYTSIPNEEFYAPSSAREFPKFSPLPYRTPALRRIELKIWAEEAVGNKNLLLSAIMSLQSISGIRATPLFATRGDASKKIRAGMPLGAHVSLYGQDMFNFLDKMIQCVLPRIREWPGVNPVGDGQGAISFKLPASAIGTFPDIEPHFDSFPRLFDVEVFPTYLGDITNKWKERQGVLSVAVWVPIAFLT
jgi:ribosomal protein L5